MSAIEIVILLAKVVVLPAAGALIGAIIKGRLEDSRLFTLRENRNVAGHWSGTLHVPSIRREKLTFDVQKGALWNPRHWFNPRLVLAKIVIGGEIIECRGGFCAEEYLLMDYRAADKQRHQFGSMLLKLDASGTHLEGDVVGYYDEPFAGRLRISRAEAS